MPRFSNLPIGRKLQAIIMLTTVVALALTCAIFAVYEVFSFRRQLVDQVTALARVVGSDSGPSLLFGDPTAAQESLAALEVVPQVVAGQILTPGGEVFAAFGRDSAERGPACSVGEGEHRFAAGELILRSAIVFEDERLGSICLFAQPSGGAERLLRYGGIIAAVLTAVSILALTFSAFQQKLISKPILELVEVTNRVSAAQDYSVRAEPRSTDEVGRLAQAFNDMLAKSEEHERELVSARAEAEEATSAKSDFLANMSHELRTPMNGVIGMTSLMFTTELTAEQQEYMEMLRTSGDSLLQLINDILDFSKIESGKMEMESQSFDLRDCVEQSLDLVAAPAAAKGLELLYRIAKGTPSELVGDVTRLRQILVNLLSNAVKFTSEGEVTVRVSARDLGADRCAVTFAVEDTGIGISPDRVEQVFGAFNQGDASMSRRYGGTGLGLAISGRLAEMFGGELRVESELGRGSTFYLTFAAQSPPQGHPQDRLAGPPRFDGQRLLIVDDNSASRDILKSWARSWDLDVRTAASGSEALALLDGEEPFAAAVLDVEMPDMRGHELAARIRRRQPPGSLPVILLSPLGGFKSSRRRDHHRDFDHILSKPVKELRLRAALNQILERQPAASAPLEDAPEGAGLPARRAPLDILLAEDNVVNQQVAVRMLRLLGSRADVVSNGREAVEALGRRRYDLVLMDILMPEMDGLEAARQICRRWPPEERPRLIAMTAYAVEGDRERCLAAGMDDYITKPVSQSELCRAVDDTLRYLAAERIAIPDPDGRPS